MAWKRCSGGDAPRLAGTAVLLLAPPSFGVQPRLAPPSFGLQRRLPLEQPCAVVQLSARGPRNPSCPRTNQTGRGAAPPPLPSVSLFGTGGPHTVAARVATPVYRG